MHWTFVIFFSPGALSGKVRPVNVVLTPFPPLLLFRPASITTPSCTWLSTSIRSMQGTTACCPGTCHFSDTNMFPSGTTETHSLYHQEIVSSNPQIAILQASTDGSHGPWPSLSVLSITAMTCMPKRADLLPCDTAWAAVSSSKRCNVSKEGCVWLLSYDRENLTGGWELQRKCGEIIIINLFPSLQDKRTVHIF